MEPPVGSTRRPDDYEFVGALSYAGSRGWCSIPLQISEIVVPQGVTAHRLVAMARSGRHHVISGWGTNSGTRTNRQRMLDLQMDRQGAHGAPSWQNGHYRHPARAATSPVLTRQASRRGRGVKASRTATFRTTMSPSNFAIVQPPANFHRIQAFKSRYQ
jgi:hypothetical protein